MKGMMDMINNMMGGGWIAVLLGFLLTLVIIAAIVFGVVYIARKTGESSDHRVRDRDRSVDILRERYARGEIDREEFEERRRALHE